MPYYRATLVDSDGKSWTYKDCNVNLTLTGPVNKNKADGSNGGDFQLANLSDGQYTLTISGVSRPNIGETRQFTVKGQNIIDPLPFKSSDKNTVHVLVLASVIATCAGLKAPLDPASITVTGTPPIPISDITVLPDTLETTIFINDLDPQAHYLISIAQSDYTTADSPFTRTPSDSNPLLKNLLFSPL